MTMSRLKQLWNYLDTYMYSFRTLIPILIPQNTEYRRRRRTEHFPLTL